MYAFVWSVFSLDRFYSLNAYVYDAGRFMQDWYEVATIHWTLSTFFLSFTFRGIKFLFFPLALTKSFALLFIFQSVFIALSSPLIYLIAVKKGLKRKFGSILAIAYLIFFPLAGTNLFDLHNIAFFPTLFIFGYYLIARGNAKTSVIFFILASIVKYPLSIIVVLFSIVAILELTLAKDIEQNTQKQKFTFFVIFLFSLSFFLVRYIYLNFILKISLPGDIYVSNFFGPHLTNYDLIITFLILLGPFLFLPLFSLKSLPFVIGYFGLATFTRFLGYGFPYGITDQFIYLLVPFLFIGTIDVLTGNSFLSIISRTNNKQDGKTKRRMLKRHTNYHFNRVNTSVYTILVIIVVLALFFAPFGPYNGVFKGTDFYLHQDLNVNYTNYNDVLELVNTVPTGNPYVVIQNGLPEFFPREFNITGNPMDIPGIFQVPGVGHGLSYNLSYRNANHQWKKSKIDFVIADPYQSTYYESDPFPYNLSMCQLVRELYNSGDYGIYSEIDGMIVLEHNYSGNPEYFEKFSTAIQGSSLISHYVSNKNISTSNISAPNHQWIHLWKTPQISLSPGKYEVNVSYSYKEPTNNLSQYSIILSTSGSTELNETTYNLFPNNLGTLGRNHVLHLYIRLNDFTNKFQIFAQIDPNFNWIGVFNVSKVDINQIGTYEN
jgi:uncharacterized membrane protein